MEEDRSGRGSAHGQRPDNVRRPYRVPRQMPATGMKPHGQGAAHAGEFESVMPVGYREHMAFEQERERLQEYTRPSPFGGQDDFVPQREVRPVQSTTSHHPIRPTGGQRPISPRGSGVPAGEPPRFVTGNAAQGGAPRKQQASPTPAPYQGNPNVHEKSYGSPASTQSGQDAPFGGLRPLKRMPAPAPSLPTDRHPMAQTPPPRVMAPQSGRQNIVLQKAAPLQMPRPAAPRGGQSSVRIPHVAPTYAPPRTTDGQARPIAPETGTGTAPRGGQNSARIPHFEPMYVPPRTADGSGQVRPIMPETGTGTAPRGGQNSARIPHFEPVYVPPRTADGQARPIAPETGTGTAPRGGQNSARIPHFEPVYVPPRTADGQGQAPVDTLGRTTGSQPRMNPVTGSMAAVDVPQTTGSTPAPEAPSTPMEAMLSGLMDVPDEGIKPPKKDIRQASDLHMRRSKFWKPVGEAAEKARIRRNHVIRNVLISLACAVLAAWVLQSTVFTVRAAQVTGLTSISQEQALISAGIHLGDSILSIDENAVAEGINNNRYLQFVRLRLDWPDGVTLFVKEREAGAYYDYCGVRYMLADDGMVLEQTTDVDSVIDLPALRGLNNSNIALGRTITSKTTGQMAAYTAVIGEMRLQDCLALITELNVADVDNIYLVTVDGYQVAIGGAKELRAKIGAMRAVREKLVEMGKAQGRVDVTEPLTPVYQPDDRGVTTQATDTTDAGTAMYEALPEEDESAGQADEITPEDALTTP